jgi:hypothetical protein
MIWSLAKLSAPQPPSRTKTARLSSWGDWLGAGGLLPHKREWRHFAEARAFVCILGLKSAAEWREYCKSGQKPDDIPDTPERVYGHKWKRG